MKLLFKEHLRMLPASVPKYFVVDSSDQVVSVLVLVCMLYI